MDRNRFVRLELSVNYDYSYDEWLYICSRHSNMEIEGSPEESEWWVWAYLTYDEYVSEMRRPSARWRVPDTSFIGEFDEQYYLDNLNSKDEKISKQIEDELNFDSLRKAEEITGKLYKEDEVTGLIGLIESMKHSTRMKNLMTIMDDTIFNETEGEYLRKMTEFGFKKILTIPFKNEEGVEDRLHILFHYGFSILLVFDTFTNGDDGSWARAGKTVPPPTVNGGNFYYNWMPNDTFNYYIGITSSGKFVSHPGDSSLPFNYLFNRDFTPHPLPKDMVDTEPDPFHPEEKYQEYIAAFRVWDERCKDYIRQHDLISIWSGEHDCREATKFKIDKLSQNGVFLKTWKSRPFLWLLHYMDTKTEGWDFSKISEERVKMLPLCVQERIRGENV